MLNRRQAATRHQEQAANLIKAANSPVTSCCSHYCKLQVTGILLQYRYCYLQLDGINELISPLFMLQSKQNDPPECDFNINRYQITVYRNWIFR